MQKKHPNNLQQMNSFKKEVKPFPCCTFQIHQKISFKIVFSLNEIEKNKEMQKILTENTYLKKKQEKLLRNHELRCLSYCGRNAYINVCLFVLIPHHKNKSSPLVKSVLKWFKTYNTSMRIVTYGRMMTIFF